MTTSSYTKMFRQLRAKPVKMARYVKHNTPKARDYGAETQHCRRCGNVRGHIGKYGLELCRKCFREIAESIGFKKYR